MGQLELFGPIDKRTDGATWWAGNWECRNWRGWFQSREGGTGNWCFQVEGFAGEPEEDGAAYVYFIDEAEALSSRRVPIDRRNRIQIEGQRYGPAHWNH